MKPVAFDYCCPDSVEEAVTVLHARRDDAKLLAGGQSLVPMLNFRVVQPGLLVDLRRLVELDFVREREGGGLSIGAMTRHRVLETSPVVARHFPVIPEAMRHVAHLAIRNRGTIGGSLAHADPAAELPMLVRLLEASIVAGSVRGERVVPAAAFFAGALTTVLEPDELLLRVELPALGPHGWAFEEFARRAGELALAATGVILEVSGGTIRAARVAMMGVADMPLRLPAAEAALLGEELTGGVVARAVDAARTSFQPRADLHGSPEYRRHLAGVLLGRALHRAWARAIDTVEAS